MAWNTSQAYGNAQSQSYTPCVFTENGNNEAVIIVGGLNDSNVYRVRSIIGLLFPVAFGTVNASTNLVYQNAGAATNPQFGSVYPQARLMVLRVIGSRLPAVNSVIVPPSFSPLSPVGTPTSIDASKYEILLDTFLNQWGGTQFNWNYSDNDDDLYGIVSKPNQPLIIVVTNGWYFVQSTNLFSQVTMSMGLAVHISKKRGGGANNQRVAGNYRLGDT